MVTKLIFAFVSAWFLVKSEKLNYMNKFQIQSIKKALITTFSISVASTTTVYANQNIFSPSKSGITNSRTNNFLVSSNNGFESWYNPYNQRIFDTKRNSYLPSHPENYLRKVLDNRNVVIIGEVHSNPCHHQVEFEVLRTLYASQSNTSRGISNIAIGMEAFYRQHQSFLDDFVFNHKDFDKLQKDTNWVETWGYDLNYYSKILRYASQHNIRILGLNVPQPIAHYVSQVGLSNVSPKLRKLLPEDIDTSKFFIS